MVYYDVVVICKFYVHILGKLFSELKYYVLTYSEWMDMDSVLVLTCLLTYFEWMDMYGVLIPKIYAIKYESILILRSMNFTKLQKPRYVENETFSLQIKKFINYTSKATLWQKIVF